MLYCIVLYCIVFIAEVSPAFYKYGITQPWATASIETLILLIRADILWCDIFLSKGDAKLDLTCPLRLSSRPGFGLRVTQ